jgi:hypothetical protein
VNVYFRYAKANVHKHARTGAGPARGA